MTESLARFQNKTIVITGGTGSFGNAVVRRFLTEGVAEIRIFSRDEKKQEDMRSEYGDARLKFHIGDVRDPNSVSSVMRGADMVFCAAALKQVPSCEFHPMEAVYTNVMGTENTLNAAIHHGVRHVIALSTDKAVYPINAMGMSKALMEKVVSAKSRHLPADSTTLCVTRYGNVMASRGSVIPLFVQQLKAGLPITITDPEMSRYMMSLDEAVDLVLYAFTHGQGGDIFVQKAPSATVGQLARALKHIFNSTSEIKIIGTRHGEKKHEALLTREEMIRAEDRDGYYRIPSDARDLNYAMYTDKGEPGVTEAADYTSENTRRLSDAEVVETLLKLDYIKNELHTALNPGESETQRRRGSLARSQKAIHPG